MAVLKVPKHQLAAQVGHRFEASPWITVSQDRINTFADCTEDHQFIHVDEKKAAQTPFGGTVAHGFLTLSLLAAMFEESGLVPENLKMGVNYGLNKVRFLAPVRAGKRIRAHIEIIAVDQKDECTFLITQQVSVEIEGEDTPALVAESLLMVFTD